MMRSLTLLHSITGMRGKEQEDSQGTAALTFGAVASVEADFTGPPTFGATFLAFNVAVLGRPCGFCRVIMSDLGEGRN